MNRRMIALVGVLAFAITLAIVIGNRLPGESVTIAFGIAVGIVLGIPAGMLAMTIGLRRAHSPETAKGTTTLVMTPQQADRLFRALERPQASPDGFTLPPRQERQFSTVGGADLADTFDESP